MYVSLEKLQRATNLIDSLADLDQSAGPDGSSEFVLAGLADLVTCDFATYQEIGSDPDHLGYYIEFPSGSLEPTAVAIFETHLHEHPLIVHHRNTRDSGPVKISDFVSRQRFHRLGIYSEYLRHIPVDDQIAFSLPATTEGRMAAFALSRSGGDFTDEDRAVLSAIKEALINALRRARDRRSAGAALATAGADGLADLTDREIQVLQLAARGRTNLAIARTFDLSPRTIAKHLEHIYRKLGVTSRAAAVYRTAGIAGRAASDMGDRARGVALRIILTRRAAGLAVSGKRHGS
jgi:DNA-binding CsgD family transcriptional regulator